MVLEVNEGFMCDYTLKTIVNLTFSKKLTDEQLTLEIAKAFLGAGLRNDPQLFIQLYRKVKGPTEVSFADFKDVHGF